VISTLSQPLRRGGVLRAQALPAAAQVASGIGNLVFAVAAAHILAPGGFADMAAFLALYLVVHVPASSLTAGGALTPGVVPHARRRAIAGGCAVGAAVAVLAFPLAGVLGVPASMLLVLATAVPLAPWLALERGRLYGERDHTRVALSLGAEPALRLALGLPLLAAAGATGGALGVVAGGWVALLTTRPGRPLSPPSRSARQPRHRTRAAWITAGVFLALALLQNQDVVFANALLDPDQAGAFAVLSTLGGLAAFASTTIPLVLLPRARDGEPGALGAAVGAAVALGLAAVAAVAVMPSDLVAAAFGDQYAGVGALAVPYVAAMALFGVARVLIAQRCATQPAVRALAAPVAIVVAQALALVTLADDARSTALITLGAMVALVASAAPGVVLRFPTTFAGARTAQPSTPWRERITETTVAIGVFTLVALVVRMIANRGIWLDEATTITQAQMSLGGMFQSLGHFDVHPPLHYLIEWSLAHTIGTDELVMRAPSYIAGAALVPVLYLTGTELWDRRAGLVAAGLGAVAPFLVWYGQEARMYSLFMLFATLALLGQLRALRRGRIGDWALYVLASAAFMWTQYFAILVIGVQQAAFLIVAVRRRDRRFTRAWLLSLLALALLIAPLAPLVSEQFHANEAAGKGFNQPSQAGADVYDTRTQPGVYVALTNLVWALWGYHSDGTMAAITSLWPLGLLVALALLGRGRSPRTLLVAACALLPAAALYLLGEAKPFLFEIRYFAAMAPLAVLLLARIATGWTKATIGMVALSTAFAASMAVASADQLLNRGNPRVYDFEGALGRISDEARPGDVVLYEPKYLSDVVRYYAHDDLRTEALGAGLANGDASRARRVFVLASFQDQPAERAAVRQGLARLRRDHPHLVQRFNRPQVEVWAYQ
jgi:O-antigen/teichoic acid export membrane protein